MLKHVARVTLRNLGLLLIAAGIALTVTGFDLALWRDGHLTDTACALFVAALAVGTFKLWRMDRRISRGEANTYCLPILLQDPTDAPEAGIRR